MANSADERRKKRLARKQKQQQQVEEDDGSHTITRRDESDQKIAKLLSKNENELLNFVVKVNKLYQEKLKRPAPFMTFAICGMQSSGKSTMMERFMSAVLNIVQEGTGTRCPLNTTCIHDPNLNKPTCELAGDELESGGGTGLTIDAVFEAITKHNRRLAQEDRFSTKPLTLVYRAKNVQNMRFVDTPGIITTQGKGKDNREDIRDILRATMKGPNTKLCVLLEPKEYSTNEIINFCNETFVGGKKDWKEDAIFLMTKFDKQLEDSRSGSKANNFFKEFFENGIYPHPAITPTLAKEDLPSDQLFQARQELLESATEKEDQSFEAWIRGHEKFLDANPDDELLDVKVKTRIGFESAKKVMREIMLEDTAHRLPEVLTALRKDLGACQNELKGLKEKQKFNNPEEVKLLLSEALQKVYQRITAYLDGDLSTAKRFPNSSQNLDDELEEEENSEWCPRDLSHHSSEEDEDKWRDVLCVLEFPEDFQTEKKLFGGKQFQRALLVFELAMTASLPDAWELKEYVASGSGYLQGGLQRENWERAITSITKALVKDTFHPGINFLIKHVGGIFRRMFKIAIDDIKKRDTLSATLKLLPPIVESHLKQKFDEMLWELMENAATKSHVSIEPMYSSLNPNLPTFHPDHLDNNEDTATYMKKGDNEYVSTPSKKDTWMNLQIARAKETFQSMTSLNGQKAKKILMEETLKKTKQKNHFLPDERTSMITDEEIEIVIRRAMQYIIALTQFNNIVLQFQMNHYLYQGFKDRLDSFTREVVNEEWGNLVEPDEDITVEIKELEGKIQGLKESLQEVQNIQQRL